MDHTALYTFLSESNVKRHLDYLNTLKLRLSILEKSIPKIKGKELREILSMNIPKSQKEEIIPLSLEILSHKLYFSSFTAEPKPSPTIRKYYFSESGFCYEMLKAAKNYTQGYLYIFKDKRGKPCFNITSAPDLFFFDLTPILLIDLYEHAYFTDYGFEKESYIKGALSRLDLFRLDCTK
jgi:superoxide dismutase